MPAPIEDESVTQVILEVFRSHPHAIIRALARYQLGLSIGQLRAQGVSIEEINGCVQEALDAYPLARTFFDTLRPKSPDKTAEQPDKISLDKGDKV